MVVGKQAGGIVVGKFSEEGGEVCVDQRRGLLKDCLVLGHENPVHAERTSIVHWIDKVLAAYYYYYYY